MKCQIVGLLLLISGFCSAEEAWRVHAGVGLHLLSSADGKGVEPFWEAGALEWSPSLGSWGSRWGLALGLAAGAPEAPQ